MSAPIVLPRLMHIGRNACGKIPETLAALGCSKPLIVTDKMMVQLGYTARITDILTASGITADIYSDTVPEPTDTSIAGGVEMVGRGDYDSVIALGGGSPIDSAKAIAVMGKHGGSIRDYRFPRQVNEAGLPLIAVPTTAGTGSECTRFTIITDEAANEKLLCVGLGFMPAAAIVDYTLTVSVPPRTTADTGIDALTHAIEAYVSRKANPFSDMQALAAMRLIGPNLRTVYHDGGNEAAREAMMLGSMLAGMAFSNASVALVHGMSRPVGAFFHVPHGLSNAMLLPAVTAYSIPAAESRYADCARAIGVALPDDGNDTANRKLLSELEALNRELNVPTLAQFGVRREDFDAVTDTMAQQALASGSPANNPRIPEHEEIAALYRQLW
ncbi:iron-containing alcohol dehydrogenase [Neisseria animalis]|uniref:Iron-containing alcohol dehydrogenase n=1 Tax=Neisseria animalis TaxID=492 RepID=A0A5P3MRR7_NEIAN|nr:iron-containing alcohol dehydrogenase [Neisseria animalis]QEY23481.1 iron-containing alcohol dehydrogenase [Neisseria animalis]ROW33328.1 iron-containing alcohol dehydrogenase [Neisseria animalis]VEE09041.1 Lactaldehyde reductase [Neisseria animalis]